MSKHIRSSEQEKRGTTKRHYIIYSRQLPMNRTLEFLFLVVLLAYVTQAFVTAPYILHHSQKKVQVEQSDCNRRQKQKRLIPFHAGSRLAGAFSSSSEVPAIDFQSNDSMYGRGEQHLSALLKDGDTVVYQTGTWTIDGIEVGDGSPPILRYATVIDIQLVWTHNCEHGVIRGLDMEFLPTKNNNHDGRRFVLSNPLHDVEFGPDQLLARIPFDWDDEDLDIYSSQGGECGTLLVELPPELITIEY